MPSPAHHWCMLHMSSYDAVDISMFLLSGGTVHLGDKSTSGRRSIFEEFKFKPLSSELLAKIWACTDIFSVLKTLMMTAPEIVGSPST